MEIREIRTREFVLSDSDTVLCPSKQSSDIKSPDYPHQVLIFDLVKCDGAKVCYMCPKHGWILIWDKVWSD